MILWFCWYGFNTGSVYPITGKDHATLAQNAAVSTTLAASSGALSALLAKLWITERETGEPVYSLSDTLMGCLAGLVSITGCCAYIQAWAAIIIGLVSGLVYLSGSHLLIRLGIDDAVDAVSFSRYTFHHAMTIKATNLICIFPPLILCRDRSRSTCSVEFGVLSVSGCLQIPSTSR